MNIIQITPHYPPNLGGVENCAREISEKLAKKGHKVEIFTSDIGCRNEKIKSKRNLKIHYLKSFDFAHTPLIYSLFLRLLFIPKDSVIHLHISKALIPEIVYLISKIRKIPYIAHFHTDVRHSGKLGFFLPLYKKLFLKRVLRYAKKIVVLTKEYESIINKKYNIKKNIKIIPNGVSKSFFINRRKILSDNIKLLYVGRLSIEKNIPKLIEAVSIVKNNVTLNIVGEGEKRGEIEKLISEKKLDNVIMHGEKTGTDLLNFYKSADIFVLASDYEGFPLVLIEAMAAGLPIIASDVRGVHELIKGSSILVKPPTADNFAKQITRLTKDQRLLRNLSIKSVNKAKNYSWEKVVSKFENIYRGLK